MGDTNDIGQNYWEGLKLFGSIVKAKKKPPLTCCITSPSAVHTMSNDYILINDRLEYNSVPIENIIPKTEIVVPVSDHLPVVSVVKEISSYTPTPIMPVATMGAPPVPTKLPSAEFSKFPSTYTAASVPAASFVSSEPDTLPTFPYTGPKPAVFAQSPAIAPSFPTNPRNPAIITPVSHPYQHHFPTPYGITPFNPITRKYRPSNRKPPRSVRFFINNPNSNPDPYNAQSMIQPHQIPGPGPGTRKTNFPNSITRGKQPIDILAHSGFEQPSNPIPSGFGQPSNPIPSGFGQPSNPIKLGNSHRRKKIRFPTNAVTRQNLFSTSSHPHPRMPMRSAQFSYTSSHLHPGMPMERSTDFPMNKLEKEEELFFMNRQNPFKNIESEEEEEEKEEKSELINNIKSISIYTKLFKLNSDKKEILRLQANTGDPIITNKIDDIPFRGSVITKDDILYFPNGYITENGLVLVEDLNDSGFIGFVPQNSIRTQGGQITIEKDQTLRLQDSLEDPNHPTLVKLVKPFFPFKGGSVTGAVKYVDGTSRTNGLVAVQVYNDPNTFGYIEFSKLKQIATQHT